MKSKIEEIIKKHTDSIISGNFSPPEGPCPKCLENPEHFTLHERKKRNFRYICESLIYTVLSLLTRWKCPICKCTFTDYPSFALPFKRYVMIDIERLTNEYINNNQTYEQTISHDGLTIAYNEQEGVIDERKLSKTTIWRWVGFFGKLEKTINGALNLIRQKDSICQIFRSVYLVSPSKFKSLERKRIIQNTMKLFHINEYFQSKKIFGNSIFPRFAAACGWS
ncbi:MAG: hypothetical protein OMM_03441 [Candidatus Magnetoglobus multicellularis str. Araruama]|uniref:DUF6431 domain-containing protein n=1 Tax=Candidatus Magnetoglobus multicellularis str. Araruama TaxID=890399 RepID=A0A1V1P5T8_9BACT|nr:MAG: hypothetical protein OMM_03441 [Candidatus Magnetoglobus multicellularis str. Araruama]